MTNNDKRKKEHEKAMKELKKELDGVKSFLKELVIKISQFIVGLTLLIIMVWIGFKVLGWLIGVLFIDDPQEKQPAKPSDAIESKVNPAESEEAKRSTEISDSRAERVSKCDGEIECIFNELKFELTPKCSKLVERQARYDVKWTSGFFGQKLIGYKWYSHEQKVVTFAGDKVKFQNRFGAWSNKIYQCHYHIEDDQIIGIEVSNGRL